MPKKSGKGKEKKMKRKEEAAKVAVAMAAVTKANQIEKPMESLVAFSSFNRNGVNVSVECLRSTAMSAEDKDWAYTLTRDNMKDTYVSCGWGWNDHDKRDEIFDERAWFIIARSAEDNAPLGLVNFRFDIDEQVEVLYVYEIQLERSVRRKGLGRFMMQLTQLIAAKASMAKVVATVFKENMASMKFFLQVLKFDYDDTSPCVCDPGNGEDYAHEIVSKRLRPVQAAVAVVPAASAAAVA
ncbi:N-alpha-acetyltransferase 40-like [Sycon ciliatum]|uniref:N-alpha-acetyltransferase 40-like n=1 Tax=Sycon ciliatum TaxID=27933 RepID=UPI0020ADF881